MKKTLALLLIAALLLSAVGLTAAETGEEPEIEKPVKIAIRDELGETVSGAALKLTDAEGRVVKTWNSDGEETLFLKEGAYAIESDLPEGYLDTEDAQVNVELTEEEATTGYVGTVTYDHDHTGICNNPKHVGLELYTVGPDNTVAYCINHGLKNPNADSRYKMLVATPDVLFAHALNKSDDITPEELYRHVMGIMYGGYDYARAQGFDDTVARYLTYMALKKYTDPKAFTAYNDNGEPAANGDGTPLGSIIAHAAREKHPLPEGFVAAYQKIAAMTDYPSDYILYLYHPDNFNGDNSFQTLLSVKQVETKTVTLNVRAAAEFAITMKWNDADNPGHRPTPAAILSKLKLYGDSRNITEAHRDDIEVIDNGDDTYTVRINLLPKRNDKLKVIAYKLRISAISGYSASKNFVTNGETVVYTAKTTTIKPLFPRR